MPIRRSRHLEGGHCGQEHELWSQHLGPSRFSRRYFTSVPQFPHLYTGSLMVPAPTDHLGGLQKIPYGREFPGSPVVRIPGFCYRGSGSAPGQGAEILQVVWHSPPKKQVKCGERCATSAHDGRPHKLRRCLKHSRGASTHSRHHGAHLPLGRRHSVITKDQLQALRQQLFCTCP